ncbi:SDR family NAD(P)-dependent oxidoreductase [Rhizomonospora bruguierae]|uniref:SDR family NAD(P)-dependent oxidoreductase n=1 Tax=Rhizomonospora bruguierae TaxID=1581705 RepID=UPI001BCFD692|nr:SDR family NAD(P)-dependent oxidoreductase [Micromonospora sp. NBRC 107566]
MTEPTNATDRLAGKVALVTGAGTGLGNAIARRMAAAGAHVVASGLQAKAAAGIDSDLSMEWIKIDVRRRDEVDATVGEIFARLGTIDIAVNNAGIFPGVESSVHQDPALWTDVIETNLNGTWHVASSIIRRLLDADRTGTIVNISSRLGLTGGGSGRASYCASKAAVSNLTRQLAVEYGPRGIRINAICPGFVPGTAAQLSQNAERIALALQQTPYTRLGLPEDVAAAAVFLASDEAAFINGHNLAVDGGASVRP